MPTKTRITHAYCVQLNKELSITDARREFFSLEEPRTRFEFLCATPACRELAVNAKITAVNYDKQPNDTYRAAHFRQNEKYAHAPDCEWMLDEDADEVDGKLPGESATDAFVRRAKRKLHDYVDVFAPDVEPASGGSEGSVAAGANPAVERAGRGAKPGRNHSSRSLERLVEYYRQARKELSEDEFKALKLRVAGEGEMPLSWYFKNVAYAKLRPLNRVIHGGAMLVDRYGAGFKLKFYDRLDGKPVFLYVSKEQMGEYRFRGYLDGLLRGEDVDYFRVFALGELALSPSGKSINLQVDDLNKLVLLPGHKQASGAEPASEKQG
ncbi:ATPase [Pseudomonas turukhanskensis]|uniref:ATPase n=1 Tax=Pseudomonas turukhanskensis TaxID=1806536 RepID=A0A9W6K707_9PSED|nr:ATPase [Pseudomonas turukhanskensis]GLK88865.1 hypothetical protein GCM10017655_19270 [Pseudomonas turukhanskensis]